ncbi:cob(I)yrinic acid a,c-diamide adenosyltransferase [Facklamia sp. DSM 111018]|uniref:Corrinoid adenosyltransferase n=1 Tax=Facklamia lactis TaxID=2749967 RepID=A0ABS0LP02_9LACT|nr:cob(I)yrinic acid a,c-diamide adenosyltransferase [Facklamia lactis]MBG9979507.1 cob(I)yrinic acid a,c-diamide adenosyltransferase [Facklamia lactis]MBG9985823.1 cob(I)yrinic acid a,c-diamide adenosyltransferase [Facklamia lactis]
MNYYTRTGDQGQTRIIGGHVYDKSHIRISTYGKTDSLNSLIGYTVSLLQEEDLIQEIQEIQQDVFDCGNDLAQINQEREYKVKADRIEWLERLIDQYAEELPALERFIIPGGSAPASLLHMCRTETREVERHIVQLFHEQDSEINNEQVLKYINRLSDYFFVIARLMNHRLNVEDVQYRNSKPVFRQGILRNKMQAKKSKE